MVAPTDRRDDRMYVYTVRSSRRSRVCLHGAIVAAIGRATDRAIGRATDRATDRRDDRTV